MKKSELKAIIKEELKSVMEALEPGESEDNIFKDAAERLVEVIQEIQEIYSDTLYNHNGKEIKAFEHAVHDIYAAISELENLDIKSNQNLDKQYP